MLKSPVIMRLLLFSSVDEVNSSMKFLFLLHDLGGISSTRACGYMADLIFSTTGFRS